MTALPPSERTSAFERWVEWALYSSRWLLAPIYLGMSVVLFAFVF